ncbi:hypothetical protein [Streptomyces sp. NPDC048516]|uniref:hypothetical protein n=1 Tax=Streptomyces sp. NPDC048516 TaxID=3365565 RepID=UPI00371B444A
MSYSADTREEAEDVAALHRAVEHGGLAPDGEELRPSPVPTAEGAPYVSTRRALAYLGALAAVILIARLLTLVLGH